MKKLILAIITLAHFHGIAQDTQQDKVSVSAYLETYYSYDINRPVMNSKPSFIYSHNRVNEVNLNLGMIRASYRNDKLRGNLSLATGSYMNANYAAEPGILKNIYEASVGIKLSQKKALWLDAGIMPSHIGWESAIGKDCYTLSRSIAAENSPYFEAGIKLGYTSGDEKWYLSVLWLNGWQRIQRPDGNSTPAWGTQVSYKPSASVMFNSSTFAGSDKPDSLQHMRYFHDFYCILQLSPEWAAIAGFDMGAEQASGGSSLYHTWYTPVLVIRHTISPKTALAVRAEYYHDAKGVVIATGTANGFKTWGYSANIDYSITPNAVWRTEIRNLQSKDAVFLNEDQQVTRNNLSFTSSLAVSF